MGIIKTSLDALMPSSEIAALLNSKSLKTGKNLPYTRALVHGIISNHNLKPLSQRIVDSGFVPQSEVIQKTGLTRKDLKKLRDTGQINNYRTAEKSQYFYRMEDFNAFTAR
ncbi:MAG: hypothetical protein PHT33_15830 [bacterium]|nr:hypothetical protein [bacterium]